MKKFAIVGAIVAVVVVVLFAILDDAGWIPRHEVTAIYVGQNGWMQGEYRDCIADTTREGTISFLACDLEGHAKEDLDRVIPHELNVTYWGRIERLDLGNNELRWQELRRRNGLCAEGARTNQERIARRGLCDEDKRTGKIEWGWRCRRNESSVTCWAVN